MTLNECAAAVQDKTFNDILELPELFLTEMQQSGLYLCFCPDKKYFHIMGAHNDIIEIQKDAVENYDIRIQVDADGSIYFHPSDKDQLQPGDRLIHLSWQSLDNSGGYVLQSDMDSVPVHLTGEGHYCIGMLLSGESLVSDN